MTKKTKKTKKNGGARARARARSRSRSKSRSRSGSRSRSRSIVKSIHTKDSWTEIPDPNEYDQIYIGIGAKCYNMRDYPFENTGAYQICPHFLDTNKTALIIIIDPSETKANIIEGFETKRPDESFKNFEFIVINNYFDDIMATQMTEFLRRRASPENVWILNFVIFFSGLPTRQEQESERSVDAILMRQIKENLHPFTDNIYKWIGQSQPFFAMKYPFIEMFFIKPITDIKNGKVPRMNSSRFLNFYDDDNFMKSTENMLENRK